MSRLRLERKVPLQSGLAIGRATSWLCANGYQTEPVAYGKAQRVYANGSRLSLRLDEHLHTLRILEEGLTVVFEFSAGLGSSGMVTDSERQELERRVDAALGLAPAAPTQIGCRICGAINAVTDASCNACGTIDFR